MPLGIISVIIGMVTLTKLKRIQKNISGKGLAVAGIIGGLICFFGALIIVNNM